MGILLNLNLKHGIKVILYLHTTDLYQNSILVCIVDPYSKVVNMVKYSDLENLASWFTASFQIVENIFEIAVTGNEGVQLYYEEKSKKSKTLVSYRSNTGKFEKDMPDMCPA